MDSIPVPGFKILLLLLTVLVLPGETSSACTPLDMRTDLIQCLQNQGLCTYYQLPILDSSKHSDLCSNSTCLAYCMETTIQACQSEAFMSHLAGGVAMKAAYLGLCAERENDTKEALDCTSGIDNQDALNVISVFETAWQGYYDNNNADNATLCSNWTSLKNSLDYLVNSTCPENTVGRNIWDSFLNTMLTPCTSLTPTFYSNYSRTSVKTCVNGAPAITSLETLHVLTLVFWIPWFLESCLHLSYSIGSIIPVGLSTP